LLAVAVVAVAALAVSGFVEPPEEASGIPCPDGKIAIEGTATIYGI